MPDIPSPELVKDIAALGTGLAAVVGGMIAILQYFKLTTHRDKVAAVRKSFEGVVASLASQKRHRLAGPRAAARPEGRGIKGAPMW